MSRNPKPYWLDERHDGLTVEWSPAIEARQTNIVVSVAAAVVFMGLCLWFEFGWLMLTALVAVTGLWLAANMLGAPLGVRHEVRFDEGALEVRTYRGQRLLSETAWPLADVRGVELTERAYDGRLQVVVTGAGSGTLALPLPSNDRVALGWVVDELRTLAEHAEAPALEGPTVDEARRAVRALKAQTE